MGWKGLSTTPEPGGELLFFSIIIPVRNEEDHIGYLLSDLEGQEYPHDHYEVIIVNDHSTDKTVEIIQNQKKKMRCPVHLIDLSGRPEITRSPKKAAITEGVRLAQGDYIIITDGDSRVGIHWLESYRAAYHAWNPKMIAGPVMYNKSLTFFEKLQAVEFASLMATGAASLKIQRPAMCNGANLSFSKSVFLEVAGFEGNDEFASGDDLFLLEKIHDRYPRDVSFLKAKNNLVLVHPASSGKEFFHQRIRWAGKWNKYKKTMTSLLAVYVFLVHASFISVVILTAAGVIEPLILVIMVLLKILLEYILLKDIFNFFNRKWHFGAFVICSLFYSVYAVLFGILSNMTHYSWKGRTFKK